LVDAVGWCDCHKEIVPQVAPIAKPDWLHPPRSAPLTAQAILIHGAVNS